MSRRKTISEVQAESPDVLVLKYEDNKRVTVKGQCGHIWTTEAGHLRKGKRCGRCCGSARKTHDEAAAVMRAAGLEPLVQYTNGHTNWPCQCTTCGETVEPRYNSIQSGQGGCRSCGDAAGASRRKLDHDEAVQVMLDAGLRPLEAYPGSLQPWKCVCGRCGAVVSPRRASVYSGQGGCVACGITDLAASLRDRHAQEAHADMVDAGLQPLVPYPGTCHPWLCICSSCGAHCNPQHGNVRAGQGGCRACAPSGYSTAKPGWLYFMERFESEMQIGITNVPQARLAYHKRNGWELVDIDGPHDGADIETREKSIKAHLKDNGLLIPGKHEDWHIADWEPSSLHEIEEAAR